ncbi:hypothetical protein N8T08_003077 [Aspergillus melleus]|uniref:Uncharacterized protein n=1 Tax=Aspergillus melleus TaxID=138277 RepID=A0ACC3B6Y1_9EURO|nr:hypothetical protein N8T08_003077 [Aspergillus melleus]
MAEQSGSTRGAPRHRALRACEPCKHRKKRCDGTEPCVTCVRYQHKCYFSLESHVRLKRALSQTSRQEQAAPRSNPASVGTGPTLKQHAEGKGRQLGRSREAISREALSYASSSKSLVDRLQAHRYGEESDQRMQSAPLLGPSADNDATATLTSALSLDHMQQFAVTYFESVHPVYSFMRPNLVHEMIAARFSSPGGTQPCDAILFGIAALGSLFSDDVDATQEKKHMALARNAQACLDADITRTSTPSFDLISALVLKTLYLRSTARTYATWITSCTLMHSVAMMEADIEGLDSIAKCRDLYFEPRRTLWIARLLNTWIANQCGRSPIKTAFDTSIVPPTPSDPVSATPEEQMIYLYHISEELSPDNQPTYEEIELGIIKLAALNSQQCHDGVLLSRTIMALSFHRVLRSSGNADMDRQTFARLVEIGLDGLQAAKRLAQRQKPWWHLANVPFQFLCAMLVIDTSSSFAQIPTALQVFEDVARAIPSSTITEALKLATKLIGLSKLQKTEQLQHLDQCSESLHQHTSQSEATSDEDVQIQPPVAGLSVPWEMFNMEELGGFSSFDWSFLPNMDIPIFDYDVPNPIIES